MVSRWRPVMLQKDIGVGGRLEFMTFILSAERSGEMMSVNTIGLGQSAAGNRGLVS